MTQKTVLPTSMRTDWDWGRGLGMRDTRTHTLLQNVSRQQKNTAGFLKSVRSADCVQSDR